MKTCTKCLVSQPLGAFGKQANTKDGLRYDCKECARARTRLWRAAHPSYGRDHYQQHAEEYKARALARYHADPQRGMRDVARWQAKNPERVRAYKAKWAADHPDVLREYVRRYQALRRNARGAIRFTAADLAAKIAYWGDRCWVCRGSWEAIDHVKPLAKGGPHALANLRPICTPCNSTKSKRWPLPALT